ncbi:hypothetical protein MMPV_000657 [Pyropia vietnamensis]
MAVGGAPPSTPVCIGRRVASLSAHDCHPPVNVFDPPLTATAAAAAVAAAPTPPPPVVIIPGYGAPASDYSGMASALRSLLPPDTPVSVVPLTRRTWAATLGGRPVTPVLGALDAAIEAAAAASADGRVNLVGHSAGGWVARIWMAAGGGRGGGGGSGGVETGAGATPMAVGGTGGSRAVTTPTVATATAAAAAAAAAAATPGVAATTTYDGRVWGGARPGGAASVVAALVTLGTPHDSAEGVTAANMRWVNAAAPGAAVPGVAYTCICGSGVVVRRSGDGTATEWRPWRKEWLAKVSYELTAGVPVRDGGGGGVGDGIVPLEVAGLAGARNVVLEGVVHSPRGEPILGMGGKQRCATGCGSSRELGGGGGGCGVGGDSIACIPYCVVPPARSPALPWQPCFAARYGRAAQPKKPGVEEKQIRSCSRRNRSRAGWG